MIYGIKPTSVLSALYTHALEPIEWGGGGGWGRGCRGRGGDACGGVVQPGCFFGWAPPPPPPDIEPRAYPDYFNKLSFYNIFVI